MRTRKNILIFYIYLLEKIKRIKPSAKNIDSTRKRFGSYLILKDIAIAALTTVLFYYLMVFMHQGYIMFPSFYNLVEMGLAFLFLLFLFWMHHGISGIMESDMFKKTSPVQRTIIELSIVILATLLLTFIVTYLPSFYIFPPEAILPERVRTAFVITIILSLFFYFLVERERNKRKLQEKIIRSNQLQKENYQAQIQSLKNQVNPHFLFNSLNVLSSLIRKNQSQAREFVHRLSKVYRSFLDHSHEQLVPLQKELELTEAYIYLLSTRFGDNVRFEIKVSEDHKHSLLPPGSLQMLVENAIKHNGSTRKKPLLIKIWSKKEELVVKNNLQPRLEKMDSTKTGLENITRRYKFLTDQEVEFTATEKEFIAKLPLLKPEAYESHNY